MAARSEIETRADFSSIRYGQLWEDADVLLQGLDIQKGEVCLSICSAGDNALAMLARDPERVVALDLNPAQLYCLELRVTAYRRLAYHALLELFGSRACKNRRAHYLACRDGLNPEARAFWDRREKIVQLYGIGGSGKFERYFRLFKDWVLPWVHRKQTVDALLLPKTAEERLQFYQQRWNNRRWQLLLNLFFSRFMMGRFGRDPAFFTYVDGCFPDHVARQVKKALCSQDPAVNPYLHWILKGEHGRALPYALRRENVDKIRAGMDKIEWYLLSTDEYAERCRYDGVTIDKHNLSDIFEYMSAANCHRSLQKLVDITPQGGRLLYWNMMVPRTSPQTMRRQLKPLTELAASLHVVDKAFFYDQLHIEERL